jgi:Protein of unknown function (DUF551)
MELKWTKLSDRLPDPTDYPRVLIYTECSDYQGEQFFDVEAESLNECFYTDPNEQPEVCREATHWAPRPYPI